MQEASETASATTVSQPPVDVKGETAPLLQAILGDGKDGPGAPGDAFLRGFLGDDGADSGGFL